MANPIRNRRQGFDTRHTIAAIVLVLLPLLALGGALMPGMVEITEEPDTSAEVARPVYQPHHVRRRPLLISRDFSKGFVPELINFDQSFVAENPDGVLLDSIAELAFGGGHGELIILDDIEEFVRDVLFKDALKPEAIEELPGGAFDESLFALIPNPIGLDSPYTYDDLAGARDAITPVPEPGTGALALLGLVGLVWMRRRRDQSAA